MLAAVAMLAVGGCAMYLSWGVWGVFVACSALTLVASSAPALVLLPRSAVTGTLVLRVASCALWLMLIGWGLVALLTPEHAIGWWLPGRGTSGLQVEDESDAHLAGWALLGLGAFSAVTTIAVGILPLLREARASR
ncbi:hypothetical protein [Ornithinimicrobium cavernae]|uniref:hypothetical protein n=1 Tax=Ornithinimicrobium cavernae TaxID=2666047 RepID=UPI000D69F209|nr:hypothetical protein [Ornithinimicrobium cavernae]